MSKLIDAFPALALELSTLLRAEGRESLARQIDDPVIVKVTFDDSVNASYIYVAPSRELNVVEANISGTRHGETITVETRFWTVIDTDNFDRLVGIEILAPGDLKAELRRRASG